MKTTTTYASARTSRTSRPSRRADAARRSSRAVTALLAAAALTAGLAACGGGSDDTEADTAVATTAPTAATQDSAASTGATEVPVGPAQTTPGTEVVTSATDGAASAPSTTEAPDPNAVEVSFDAPKGEPRPINETSKAIDAATQRLSMKITNLSYRGVVCGFTFHGKAPASPVKIRLHGVTPSGSFDSGLLDVSWTALDSHAVTSAAAQDGSWNFSSEAHPERSGNGWVISLGGVTGGENDDSSIIPTSASCELTTPAPGFLPENGPVGLWAGYAAV